MKNNIALAVEEIAMFCRLQMYIKKGLPIRSSEMGVLIYVQKETEAVTPLMISEFFQVTKPSVTAMINELVKRKYLEKIPSDTDRRSYNVAITDLGHELVENTETEYFKSVEILKEKMGVDEFNIFIKLIKNANEILKGAKA